MTGTTVEGHSERPASSSNDLNDVQLAVLKTLREQRAPLFALLDAARDDRVLDLLQNSGEKYQSLYEGQQGEDLANFAPYLVALPQHSSFLRAILKEGWGKSWGVYLTCTSEFGDLRKHLRHFLEVTLPGGKNAYFRFYDPRVLRVYLPNCTADDTKEFFGPIAAYLAEDEDAKKCCILLAPAKKEI